MDDFITEYANSKEYLTEKKLGSILEILYPSHNFIHNKAVPNSGLRNRPDYRNSDLMLIVEFDGHYHFTNPITILRDELKDRTYKAMGYKIIRIPYFIQIDSCSAHLLFDSPYCLNLPEPNFPQGFITKNAVTPANFCSLGLMKFEEYWAEYFINDKLGEYVALRNIWLQLCEYGRNKLEVFPLDFCFVYEEEIDAVMVYGYPT